MAARFVLVQLICDGFGGCDCDSFFVPEDSIPAGFKAELQRLHGQGEPDMSDELDEWLDKLDKLEGVITGGSNAQVPAGAVVTWLCQMYA